MKFRKPPVVEVWISIDFEPNENKRQWDLSLVQEYMRQSQGELPRIEVVHEQTIQVQETSPTDLPKVVNKDVRLQSVRMWDEARSQMLQVGDDQFAFHVLKTATDTPGYKRVREAAHLKVGDYIRIFQPNRIRHATLHYLDIIDIPAPGGTVELTDYFRHAVDLPKEPFGPVLALTHQLQVKSPLDEGSLFVRLQNIPSDPDQETARFRLEWHKQSIEINTLDSAEMWRRMEIAHNYMRDCFNAFLTRRTLDLFEPVHET